MQRYVNNYSAPTRAPSPVLNSEQEQAGGVNSAQISNSPSSVPVQVPIRALVGDGEVRYISNDGSTMVKKGGSLSWRFNNPGAVRRGGTAIARASGFAIFATEQAGVDALHSLILSEYRGLNPDQFIGKYAPASENATDPYVQFLCERLGISRSDVIDVSDAVVRDALVRAITDYEGWKVGSVTHLPSPDSPLVGVQQSDEEEQTSVAMDAVVKGLAVVSASAIAVIIAGLLTGVIQNFARRRRFQPGVGGLWTKLAAIPSFSNPYPLCKLGTVDCTAPVGISRIYERISILPVVTLVARNGLAVNPELVVVDKWGGVTTFDIESSSQKWTLLSTTITRSGEPGPTFSRGDESRWLIEAVNRDTLSIEVFDLAEGDYLQNYWLSERIANG